MEYLILVINPGSTSTKVSIFKNNNLIADQTIRHDSEQINAFPKITLQKDFRKELIINFLKEKSIKIEDVDVFVGRGGLLRPISGGTYLVTKEMVDDLFEEKYGSHASNLGAILAYELASPLNKPAYIVDPVVVDELDDIARVSGFKGIERISIFHALNQKAVANRYAHEFGKTYNELNLIVAHLGGGISIGLHKHGKIVDVNNALGGEGPMSPERSGTLPVFQIIDLCYSNKYQINELKKLIVGKGGLVSYLGTSNGLEISKRIENNDQEAKFYLEAMAYQIAKEIGSLYFVAKGEIDAIIITGGLAYNKDLINPIKDYINPIKPITLYPGEDEMISLAEGVLRVLNKQEDVKTY